MARDLRNGSFFLRFSFLPFPSHRSLRLPLSSFFPSSFVPLRLRRHGGCTRVRTRAPSSSFADSPLFASFFPLLLLSCFSLFPQVHLLLHRRRTFVHVPVHSFVKSPLASSGHVAHAATKRGRNGRTVLVAQMKMANDSFTLPFYPPYQFFHLLFFVLPLPNAYHLLFSRRKIPWNYDERKVKANEVAVRSFYHSPIPVEAQTCGQRALPLARKRVGLVDRAADLFGPCRPFCIGILKSRGMKREEKLQGEAYYYASE